MRVGDTVVGTLDFTCANVGCHQVYFFAESFENLFFFFEITNQLLKNFQVTHCLIGEETVAENCRANKTGRSNVVRQVAIHPLIFR